MCFGLCFPWLSSFSLSLCSRHSVTWKRKPPHPSKEFDPVPLCPACHYMPGRAECPGLWDRESAPSSRPSGYATFPKSIQLELHFVVPSGPFCSHRRCLYSLWSNLSATLTSAAFSDNYFSSWTPGGTTNYPNKNKIRIKQNSTDLHNSMFSPQFSFMVNLVPGWTFHNVAIGGKDKGNRRSTLLWESTCTIYHTYFDLSSSSLFSPFPPSLAVTLPSLRGKNGWLCDCPLDDWHLCSQTV